jgi:hypothetical protein
MYRKECEGSSLGTLEHSLATLEGGLFKSVVYLEACNEWFISAVLTRPESAANPETIK